MYVCVYVYMYMNIYIYIYIHDCIYIYIYLHDYNLLDLQCSLSIATFSLSIWNPYQAFSSFD